MLDTLVAMSCDGGDGGDGGDGARSSDPFSYQYQIIPQVKQVQRRPNIDRQP